MKRRTLRGLAIWIAAPGILAAALVVPRSGARPASAQPNDDSFADFVEPGFPFITTTVDARGLGPGFSEDNVATRGLVLQLGNETYAAFDPDLLRMAVGWRGEFLELTTMAQISYREPLNKNNQIPRVLGHPIFTNGLYAGWMGEEADFRDPRPPGPNPEDPGRGPIAEELGRWNGVYVVGDRAVLAYTVLGTEIREQPGSVAVDGEVGIVRAFRLGRVARPLTLVAAEVRDGQRAVVEGNTALVYSAGDTVTAVGVVGGGGRLEVAGNRYVTLRVPASSKSSTFRVVTWRGPASRRGVFARLLEQPFEMVRFERGGPRHWPEVVRTSGVVSPDTSAYVVDRITLPIPNPWRRNVRPADVDFFRDGRAAVVTFEGDVWIVKGIDRDLDRLEWKRFASGLYETLAIEVVDEQVYVYGREGIVRLHDLNRDGEADYYENFTNLIVQSIESREFPLSMDERPGGGFYVSKGGALDLGPKTAPRIMPGFRAGSRHAGTVLEVSADGRTVRTYASGLREPFVGVHPRTGALAASDQQGNFVPSTPVYLLREGGYYGVPATAHRDSLPAEQLPVVWLPHKVDQSGSGEVWVPGDRMGFGGDALIHLSYGRPGAFRIFVDSASRVVQGAAVSILDGFDGPLLKGQVHPRDGQLYLLGFQVWGSKAREIRTFVRLRYTGKPSTLPVAVRGGRQGVLLRFATPLDPATATDPSRYEVQRWNYRRTSAYGSPHFKLDGAPGQERLPVASAHLSADGKSLLLVIPEMREAMQMEVAYTLQTAEGRPVADTVYLTLHVVDELDLVAAGFGGVDWRSSIARATASATETKAAAASAELGAQIYQRVGCVACHSTDGSTAGKLGPTFRGLYGSQRTFADGSTARADEAYLRQSILEPAAKIVQGYQEGMPSYLGVLSDAEIESLILYIRSLANE
jgi:cytochrome c2